MKNKYNDNMKAEEKAKELVEKFKPFVYCYMGSGMLTNDSDDGVILSMSKKCAIIAVDEIIDSNLSACIDDFLEYWEGVKKEIEKLKLT